MSYWDEDRKKTDSPPPYSYVTDPDDLAPAPYSYVTDPDAPGPAPYSYVTEPDAPAPAPYSYVTELDNYGSRSGAPSAPAGYATPPTPAPAPAPPSASKGPTDAEIDAMLAAGGGRISSRAMRALETKGRSSNLPQWPPPQPAEKSPTELKREKIMSRINKTKTHDSEGGDLSFAGKDDAPLAGKKLVSKYQGEDKSVAWRMGEKDDAAARWGMQVGSPEFDEKWNRLQNSDKVTTNYDTSANARDKSLLKERGGGKVKATHDKRQWGDRKESGWVMEPSSGNIHTFDPTLKTDVGGGKSKTTHHSSPLAGGNVAGAGMMTIKDKHIHEVTDESGHYRPEGEYTYQAVKEMASRGLLDRKADEDEVDEHEAGEGNLSAKVSLAGFVKDDPRQQKGWLEHEQGISTDKLTLPYQAFLQTRGNERQARAKVSALQELKSKVPEIEGYDGSATRGASSLNSASQPAAPAEYVDYFGDSPASYTGYEGDEDEIEYESAPGYSVMNENGEVVPLDDDNDHDDDDVKYESAPGYSIMNENGEVVPLDEDDDDEVEYESAPGYSILGEDGVIRQL